MSFVVAVFIEARETVILPENWIKDLNTAKLKNNGCNSNQNFRAYYRIDGLGNNDPNFNAPLLTSMKDLREEGCFLCRIKKFFGKLLITIQMLAKCGPFYFGVHLLLFLTHLVLQIISRMPSVIKIASDTFCPPCIMSAG